MTGFVYFIEAAELGLVKIGYATNVKRRFAVLQTASPVELRLLNAIASDRAGERVIHARFAHLRRRGEWFRSSGELLEFAARPSASSVSAFDDFAVIEALGGATRVASALSELAKTDVSSKAVTAWRIRDRIPGEWRPWVARIAAAVIPEFSTEQFLLATKPRTYTRRNAA